MTREEAVAAADALMESGGEFDLRSCWECNPSHEHLKERFILCFECGRYFFHGVDITDYEQEATDDRCKKDDPGPS